jgi:ribosomal protein S18 acetylase RimI-like enzyme
MTVVCRPATEEDLDGIAAVRIRTWQDAYRGIMPQDYLDGLAPAAEAVRLRARGLRPGNSVAELDGAIVGWSAVGPYREDDVPAPWPGCGEIIAIYVLPGHQGAGIGRALLTHSLGVLGELRPALLWVARDNAPARRFYERYGFRADGATQTFTVGGTEVLEVRYRYPA